MVPWVTISDPTEAPTEKAPILPGRSGRVVFKEDIGRQGAPVRQTRKRVLQIFLSTIVLSTRIDSRINGAQVPAR